MAKKKPTNETRDALIQKSRKEPAYKEEDLLSLGSTLLNMSISGSPHGAIPKGKYVLLIGASGAGKTFLAMTTFAEAMQNPNFSHYRLILDDVEEGSLMDFTKYFGEKVAERVEAPAYDEQGYPIYSEDIEDFYFGMFDAIEDGRPFIWVLDSIDALSSKAEGKKLKQHREAKKKGKDAAGSFGDGKAKVTSQYIRRVITGLRKTGSILIIINQERDNIDAGLFDEKKTHSGGRALKFYATAQIWASLGKQLKKSVRSKDRAVGVEARVRVRKNRLTGKDRSARIPIFYDYGIDDIGSCVEFLCENKRWPRNKEGLIDTKKDFDCEPLKKAGLIEFIEQEGLEGELKSLVFLTWQEIEEECKSGRKARYK